VPLGLFFVTGDKKFVPIAIQLYQHIAPNNPVNVFLQQQLQLSLYSLDPCSILSTLFY